MSPDTVIGSIVEKRVLHPVEQYYVAASSNALRCVDERAAEIPSNGVQIPGGIGGVIDAIKHFTGYSEDDAWEIAIQAQIPLDGHIDHHGARGCGYERLVEDEPNTVLAPESISAQKRLDRIKKYGGNIQKLLGDHHGTHAVINRRENITVDSNSATKGGFGIFNFDYLAAKMIGEQLHSLGINPTEFADHLEQVYRRTVTALTGMKDFIILE